MKFPGKKIDLSKFCGLGRKITIWLVRMGYTQGAFHRKSPDLPEIVAQPFLKIIIISTHGS